MRLHRVDERERVAVRADRGFGLRGAQQVRDGVCGGARFKEVVADAGGRCVQFDQPLRRIAMDAPAAVRRHVVEQGIAHETMTEPVPGRCRFDH